MACSSVARFSAVTSTTASRLFRSRDKSPPPPSPPPPATLGILAFDTAKTMSRLISLYMSLTDDEIDNLWRGIKSEGVAYLNSQNEARLLNLACRERLEALDSAVNTISVLGRKCSDLGLNMFDRVYADLKLGLVDTGRLKNFASRKADRIIEKMEKLTALTASLYSALETLAELETSERKLQKWNKNESSSSHQKTNYDLFERKIAFQRKLVNHYKEVSLWSRTMDKCVGMMARTVCILFRRICLVFGSCMPDSWNVTCNCMRTQKLTQQARLIRVRGEAARSAERSGSEIFYSRQLKMDLYCTLMPEDASVSAGPARGERTSNRPRRVFNSASESTVGGSGLAPLYANLIILAEQFLNSPETIGEDARSFMYEMLPTRLKMKVRAKMRRSNIMGDQEEYHSDDGDHEEEMVVERDGSSRAAELAEGWRDALEAIMEWLVPLAHDTVRWQSERNLEKKKFDAKPTVLLIQTLHYSDLEKTEAAIVEVLVGLSCICRCMS